MRALALAMLLAAVAVPKPAPGPVFDVAYWDHALRLICYMEYPGGGEYDAKKITCKKPEWDGPA